MPPSLNEKHAVKIEEKRKVQAVKVLWFLIGGVFKNFNLAGTHKMNVKMQSGGFSCWIELF